MMVVGTVGTVELFAGMVIGTVLPLLLSILRFPVSGSLVIVLLLPLMMVKSSPVLIVFPILIVLGATEVLLLLVVDDPLSLPSLIVLLLPSIIVVFFPVFVRVPILMVLPPLGFY